MACGHLRRPGYNFLTSNFADGKNIQFTIRTLSRPTLYLVDNSDRDSSEGPEKSTVGDRNDGIREVEVPVVNSNHPPFST